MGQGGERTQVGDAANSLARERDQGVEPLSEQPLEVLEVHGWAPTGHADRVEFMG
jgi:hypothetical protein